MTVRVNFWGVRGSFPCASIDHMRYGGNTSCVTVETEQSLVILDAGTGLFPLGKSLLQRKIGAATLLLSHTHTDHILGFPFFAPAWRPDFALSIMAGHLKDRGGVRAIFEDSMRDPVFPVSLDKMGGQTKFIDFEIGDTLAIASDITARTGGLRHPNGATGYRVETQGHAIAYITDTEHRPDEPDENVLALIAGADLVIYDSTYNDGNFPTRIGWGHSTWQEGIRLCRQAEAKALAIFHHDPDNTDQMLDQIEAEARLAWPNAVVAHEGMVVEF